jgi:prepilin-type N-terminal cleavage/methylation domain-containing protein
MIRLQRHNRTAGKISSPRRGVTMTEVLIAIMILGIGMTSLMTLFPIGLLKIRDARRNNRASLMAENVASDLKTRDLLSRYSFAVTLQTTKLTNGTLFDPWSRDIQAINEPANIDNIIYTEPKTGSGFPIVCCYDPLFFSNLAYTRSPLTPTFYENDDPSLCRCIELVAPQFRFGQAFNNDLRTDPDGKRPSALGLPRLTNIWPALANPAAVKNMGDIISVSSIFVSQDDPVFPDFENEALPSGRRQSPILPLVDYSSTGSYYMNDWDYSWIFTGVSRDNKVFQGDMVIYNKRQFGVQTDGNSVTGIAGERVVEGIFGLGSIPKTSNGGVLGYAAGQSRKVLLMWPKRDGVERPEIKIGGWISDVTYERYIYPQGNQPGVMDLPNQPKTGRFYSDFDGDGSPDVQNPGQRCNWYRIVQRSEVTDAAVAEPGLVKLAGMEAMVVTVDRPVVAKTLLIKNGTGYEPAHVNAALIAPEVVSVFPITLEGF